MRFEIVFASPAVEDYKALDARGRSEVRAAIEQHLRHQPTRTSRSRIKRLKGLSHPQFRLRVGEIRIYYDVVETTVQVLAIVEKSRSHEWLEKEGESE